MTVTIFGSPNCMPCRSTKRLLDKNNVEYDYYDVTADPEAHKKITDLGYTGIPVVFLDDQHFQGYRPDLLKNIL